MSRSVPITATCRRPTVPDRRRGSRCPWHQSYARLQPRQRVPRDPLPGLPCVRLGSRRIVVPRAALERWTMTDLANPDDAAWTPAWASDRSTRRRHRCRDLRHDPRSRSARMGRPDRPLRIAEALSADLSTASTRTLAAELGLSKDTCARALRRLRSAGLIDGRYQANRTGSVRHHPVPTDRLVEVHTVHGPITQPRPNQRSHPSPSSTTAPRPRNATEELTLLALKRRTCPPTHVGSNQRTPRSFTNLHQ